MPSPARRPVLNKAATKAHPVVPSPESELANSTTATPQSGSGLEVSATPDLEGSTAMLSARVPIEIRDAVKFHAVKHRTSVQAIVTSAVKEYLNL